jgi:hypothetical protein
MNRLRNSAAAVAVAFLAMSLAACSSGGSSSQSAEQASSGSTAEGADANGEVYQFENFSAGPAEEFTVTIPDDLLEAAGLERSDLLAPTVVIRAHKLDTAKACAVDLVHEYSDGVTGAEVTPEQKEAITLSGSYLDTSNVSDVLAERLGRTTSTLTGDVSEGTAVHWEGAASINDLDATDPEEGYYFSDDLKTVTLVTECASSPSDVDRVNNGTNRITFRFWNEGSSSGSGLGTKELAYVAFNVMRDGTITLISPDVDGFEPDANGYWIAD